VTNELGQIRICDLVATKAHSQFERHLAQVRKSLELYGHEQPEVFYTDDMKQKGLLTSAIPSLLRGVVPVEKYSFLKKVVIPNDVFILTKNTTQGINHAIDAIMTGVQGDETIAVGFDIEWNVDLAFGSAKKDVVALIQLAFGKNIWLLQVCNKFWNIEVVS
jgi:hypothetical protein